jgi:RNA polymerase-binding transcription factor DksA
MSTEENKEKLFYTKEELEEFRGIINKKLATGREEYASLEDNLRDSSEASADGNNLTDFGSDNMDKEQLEMFMSRTRKFIDSLERALIRIENGTYGRCKLTGKLIAKERLRIVPHTESSMEAKKDQLK